MAATEYTISSVAEDTDRGLWHVAYEDAAGTSRTHVFPKVALAWRAAEYGIDPADTDTLLDVILHEPFAPHPDDPRTAADDPVAAAGITSPAPLARGAVQAGDLVPTTLYTAETTAQAREAHMLRIEHTKANRARVVPPQGRTDPLAVIRRTLVDPGHVAELAARVDHARRRLRGEPTTRDTAPMDSIPIDATAELRAITIRNDKEADRA